MKKILVIVLALIMILCFLLPAFADSQPIASQGSIKATDDIAYSINDRLAALGADTSDDAAIKWMKDQINKDGDLILEQVYKINDLEAKLQQAKQLELYMLIALAVAILICFVLALHNIKSAKSGANSQAGETSSQPSEPWEIKRR